MNAMLSDRLALAQRRRFGSSSEKYADGYEQMDLFNEAEVNADMDTAEIDAVYDAQRSPFCFRTVPFSEAKVPPIFS
ncbi:transposase [Roseburia intestinalis]|uniref:transposase n=1 Tax=Roseburia intestinalis TaxID=166486 RepID=UPI0021A6C49B|nr:transposase [Roseburia intestinalis]UWP55933.1 transposase [Roseburia intestinalis]